MRQLSFTRNSLIALALFVFWIKSTLAAEYISHSVDQQSLVVTTDEGRLTVTAYGNDAFEVFYQPTGVKQLPSFALAGLPDFVEVKVDDSSDKLVFTAGDMQAVVTKSPLHLAFYQAGKFLVEEESGLFVTDTHRGFRFKLQPQERFYGGGQRVVGMDRRGQAFPLYNKAHYDYNLKSNQMYYGLSAVMSTNRYALVFDNSARGYMNIGYNEPDILQFEGTAGRTSYLVIGGQSYPEMVSNITGVTGRQPLPPRWALGNFASRFGYHSEAETREVVDRFIKADIPLDAVVLDLFWFGKDIKGHMGNLDWDREAFPTAEQMIADFQNQGVQTVVITEPFILNTSKNWEDAVTQGVLAKNHNGKPREYGFYFGITGLIDVFDSNAQDWFGSFYQRLFDQGVTGWWGDLGEPEVHPGDMIHNLDGMTATADEIHNAYGHKWAEMVYNKHREMSADTRPLVLMRSGFVGTQRYGILPWTGDVQRSWDGLKPQVELSLQMGMFGLGYTHSDLGGFAGGETFDKEMYIRWLQFGVFQPVYRPHGQENIAPEPVYHDEETQEITREFIKLRYRLMPYNYSLAYQNSLTGLPLMRPMIFEDESNPQYFDEKDQYLWGEAFLVKPVTEAGIDHVTMTLPAGTWFDFWTDKAYAGGGEVKVPTSLRTLPVLVRAGSFIPMTDSVQTTRDYSTANLELHYYADASVKSADYTMYEDDGVDPNAIENKQYQALLFSANQDKTGLTINLQSQGAYKGQPTARKVSLIVHNVSAAPSKVGLSAPSMDGSKHIAPADFSWDEKSNQLTINFTWQHDIVVHIN